MSLVGNQFYQINNEISQPETNKYLIQTRSQAKSSGIKVPERHGMNKGLNPHVKPGKQDHYQHYLCIVYHPHH